MNIEKAEKVLNKGQLLCIEIVEDGINRCVPENEDNRHYKELKKLEREGKIQITDKKLDQEVQPIGE